MKSIEVNSDYHGKHQRRFQRTIQFIHECQPQHASVLDLGPNNPLSELIRQQGHRVENTASQQDLDLDFHQVEKEGYEVVTAFEILEHLVSPFPLLKAIRAPKLILSVPLKLWFAEAYWNPNDPYDCHYHEFEPKQLRMLLEKAGWTILKEKQYTNPEFALGIRPILRYFTPRHMFVYCERNA